MPDPIQVESEFQELMLRLETTASIRHRHTMIRQFLESLSGEYKKYETYIFQIVDEIPLYTISVSWSGLSPQDVEEELRILENTYNALQPTSNYNRFGEIINNLRAVCILLYCCLDDVLGVNKHLKLLCNLKISEGKQASLFTILRGKLSRVLQKKEYASEGQRVTVENLLNQIQFIQNQEKGKVLIPVVEKYSDEESTCEYGRLRILSVEIYGAAKQEDQLVQNFRASGTEKKLNAHFKKPLTAARKLFETNYSNRDQEKFKGGAGFELTGAIHDGNSANLAIASLWYAGLLKSTGQRERFEIHPKVAITGDIDEEEIVLPIEKESIRLKAKAAFFSWAKMLVVPYSQQKYLAEELEKLFERYPNRRLDLIGVNQLREIFYDRRLSDHEVQSRVKYYFNKAKSQKYRIVTVPLITILIAIIGWLILGPIDQNPVTAEFEGEYMILKNQYGQQITTFAVGENVVEYAYVNNEPIKVAFRDINQDGINEVFFARQVTGKNEKMGEELVAFSVKGDSVIWRNPLEYALDFPSKPGTDGQTYQIYNIDFIERDSLNQEPELVVNIGYVSLFPSLLVKINSHSGREISHYVHTGRIFYALTEDYDSDGVDEVLGLGQNNAFNENAVIFALEPDSIFGHSPLNDEYKINGFSPAKETHYIRFPQTFVGKAFRRRVMSNSPSDISINSDEKIIEIRLHDFNLSDPSPFEINNADLFFYFNYNFEIQSIDTDSHYDLWAKNLFEDGLIPFEPDHEYFEAFKDSLLYWDGEEFVLGQN